MTYYARLIFEDCKGALEDVKDPNTIGITWRRRWVAAIALLRTTLDVLHNEDGKTSEVNKKVIEEKYKEVERNKDQYQIYWDFIKDFRDVALHHGRLGVGMGTRVTYEEGEARIEQIRRINSGPFNGRDAVELLEEAILWVEIVLDEIDEEMYLRVPIGTPLEQLQGVGNITDVVGNEICSATYSFTIRQAQYGCAEAGGFIRPGRLNGRLERSKPNVLVVADGRKFLIGFQGHSFDDRVSGRKYRVKLSQTS